MTYDPLAAPIRHLQQKAAAIAAMRREDYATLRDFRRALSRRCSGVRRLVAEIEARAAKEN